jgi:DNA-binding MarR family transcriptional regulator
MGIQWIQIPRKFLELNKGTKFVDVLVYAAIDNQKDSTTHTSKIGMRTIADKYNIPLSKVEDAVKRLKESGYLDFTQHPSPNNTEYKYNQYTFPLLKDDMVKDGFLMLMPEVLSLPLKPKDRGILIYLQLIALPNMNDIGETKIEDIADRIGVCRQTASKYLKKFLEIGQLHKSSSGYFYQCQYLDKDIQIDNSKDSKLVMLC